VEEQSLISIITPSLNRAGYITEAIESVLHQDYPNFEHIIMDGGSTDETLEILTRYPHLKVITKKDAGLYDAINKGIQLATGEIVGILNTDDMYEPGIFDTVMQTFVNNPSAQALSGGSAKFTINRSGQRKIIQSYPCIYPGNLLIRATIEESSFNAWFFNKNLFAEMEGLDIRYSFLADRDFLIRFALEDRPFASLEQVLYHYRQHPGSLTQNTRSISEEPLGFEARLLAQTYLEQNLNGRAKKAFIAWHNQIIIGQVLSALRRKAFTVAKSYISAGCYYDFFWPIQFILQTPPRAVKYLLKKLRWLGYGDE
jgi:glycosyltransferase involved in cell wall biosynthesis